MARGKSTILIAAGGLLLVLSHAAAWHLGRESESTTASGAGVAEAPRSPRDADPAWTPAELLRRGREHEAAILAAEQAEREAPLLPWQTRVENARVTLSADADFATLVRDGMAAVKHDREGPSPETVVAFGKWLELDPDAALDFLGRTGRDQLVSRLLGEVERWLGQGNHQRLDDLMTRFPMARGYLLETAQGLCLDRGPDFLLDLFTRLTGVEDRLTLLCDTLPDERWQGHLAKVVTILSPRETDYFLRSVTALGKDPLLFDEMRAAGFPAEALDELHAEAAKAAAEEKLDELERQRQLARQTELRPQDLPSEIRRQAAETFAFGRSAPPALSSVMPDFDDKLADLRDGRCSGEDLLADLKAAWPAAAGLEGELRRVIYAQVFTEQPVESVRWLAAKGGEAWQRTVIGGMRYLSPEQMVRVVEEFPDLAETENSYPARLFQEWHQEDPDACHKALLRYPNPELRDLLLKEFSTGREEGAGP